MIKISPSILASKNRIESVLKLNETKADYLHIDAMDGIFVPNTQMKIDEINVLEKHSNIPLDVHLMIDDPEVYIDKLENKNIEYITIHVEINKDIINVYSNVNGRSANPSGSDVYKLAEPSIKLAKYELVIDEENGIFPIMSLYDIWMCQKESCDWVYADETPYFVKISIPTYDDNDLYCAYMKHGGWFSLDIQSSWQGGVLDVDNKKWNYIIEEYINFIKNKEEREKIRKLYTSSTYLKK